MSALPEETVGASVSSTTASSRVEPDLLEALSKKVVTEIGEADAIDLEWTKFFEIEPHATSKLSMGRMVNLVASLFDRAQSCKLGQLRVLRKLGLTKLMDFFVAGLPINFDFAIVDDDECALVGAEVAALIGLPYKFHHHLELMRNLNGEIIGSLSWNAISKSGCDVQKQPYRTDFDIAISEAVWIRVDLLQSLQLLDLELWSQAHSG